MSKPKTHEELDKIAIKIINLLADEKVSVNEVIYILEIIPKILKQEIKIKRID